MIEYFINIFGEITQLEEGVTDSFGDLKNELETRYNNGNFKWDLIPNPEWIENKYTVVGAFWEFGVYYVVSARLSQIAY